MTTRRESLAAQQRTLTTNAGLWLAKFIRNQGPDDTESRHSLVCDVSEIPVPAEYSSWFERWQRTLQDYGCECREAVVRGRMVVGLGAESVLESSIALHHTYGVPYIPGSALKGMVARFAQQHLGDGWQPGTPAYVAVFGDTATAGYLTFFDAMPLPKDVTVHADVITVHHKGYYRNDPFSPPADWDDPNPVPFLSATGTYLVALAGPSDWVGATFEILQHALAHLGIGAKTSSGYGRMQLAAVQPADADRTAAEELIAGVQRLKPSDVAGRIFSFYEAWRRSGLAPSQKRRVAEAIVAKVREAGRERHSRDKDWYRELLASIR